jgi:hypothetical protein
MSKSIVRELVEAVLADERVQRVGDTTGRFADYHLVVDGVDLGRVHRKVVKGSDRLLGREQPAYDVWAIHGTELPTQEEAEAALIKRSINFGYIKP